MDNILNSQTSQPPIQREGDSSAESSSSDPSKAEVTVYTPQMIEKVAKRVYELMLQDLLHERERLGQRRF
jgi:hypothetical protein